MAVTLPFVEWARGDGCPWGKVNCLSLLAHLLSGKGNLPVAFDFYDLMRLPTACPVKEAYHFLHSQENYPCNCMLLDHLIHDE
jgi:hypothetical protein